LFDYSDGEKMLQANFVRENACEKKAMTGGDCAYPESMMGRKTWPML